MIQPRQRDYLILIEELGIVPNFYTSDAYFYCANLECFKKNGVLYLVDDDWFVLPPISKHGGVILNTNSIWADFENHETAGNYSKLFLDNEYIYDPKKFNNMSGKSWEVFRKNSRKWKRENEDYSYQDHCLLQDLSDFIVKWIEENSEVVEDAEFIVSYLLSNSEYVHKKFLFNSDGDLVGVNAWDENYKYINYRICITSKDEKYCNEFLRLLFYTSETIQNKNKLVNDGGDLGDENLAKFKRKLNPLQINKRYSLIKKV